jgi:hypothetical protein
MKKSNPNLCEIKKCYEPHCLTYYNHKICQKHWLAYAEGKINLKMVLNIPIEEPRLKMKEKPIKSDLKVYI